MDHYIPYARTDMGPVEVEKVVEWLQIDKLLEVSEKLPRNDEIGILVEFLIEFSGGMEIAKRRMEETLLDQSAVSYNAYAIAVQKIKKRLMDLLIDQQ